MHKVRTNRLLGHIESSIFPKLVNKDMLDVQMVPETILEAIYEQSSSMVI